MTTFPRAAGTLLMAWQLLIGGGAPLALAGESDAFGCTASQSTAAIELGMHLDDTRTNNGFYRQLVEWKGRPSSCKGGVGKRSAGQECGVGDVMGKSKVAVLCLILIAASLYGWSQRQVTLEIAGVRFRIPNPAIVSASGMRNFSGGLDSTQGAFLELPNGPYFGKWGIFLQSSRDRKAKGFPSPFDAMVAEKSSAEAIKMTAFGWYECTGSCGKDTWYFRRSPTAEDSVYSVNSIVCHKTGICELLFAFRDVDVSVTLQQNKVDEASKILEQALGLVSSFAVVGK